MFTGIIKNIGIVKQFKKKTNCYYLTVISKLQFTKKDIGTSISCSGVCLTLTKIKK
ncbi:MAG: riboflavin synthase, partial [Candidatus Fonsibacter sp.]